MELYCFCLIIFTLLCDNLLTSAIGPPPPYSSRQRYDYSTDRNRLNGHLQGTVSSPKRYGDGTDFNPELFGGNRAYPGIKIRLNQKAFLYAGNILGDIVDNEIRTARLPAVRQCISQLNGCVTVYNMYIHRYRCAQRVVVYPSPPNRVSVAVQNFDIGIAGNLGGQIVVLLPVTLTGIVYMNIHQLSIVLQMDIIPSPSGQAYIRVSGCSATVGYVDIYVQNAGLVGDVVNNQFRSKVSEKLRAMLPSKLCEMLPQQINQKLNRKLAEIPLSIGMSKIQSFVKGILGEEPEIPLYCYSQECQDVLKNATALPPPEASQAPRAIRRYAAASSSAVARRRYPSPVVVRPRLYQRSNTRYAQHYGRIYNSYRGKRMAAPNYPGSATGTRRRYQQIQTEPASLEPAHQQQAVMAAQQSVMQAGANGHTSPGKCLQCPRSVLKRDPLQAAKILMHSFDLNKLSDIYLTTQLLHTYATPNDFTLDITGVFSPGNRGVPFGAFPMYFPKQMGNRMAEVLVSDFTLNSLLYSMHRKNFLTFRIGPETPKLGPLLKTTCAEDEDEEELEDHGVELDEEGASSTAAPEKQNRTRRQASGNDHELEEEGGLADLGICFGDIVPSVRESHPNKEVYIILRSSQAPSVVFRAENGGTAKLELKADAEIHIADSGERVGAISIEMAVDVAVHEEGGRVKGTAEITRLKLMDKEQSLGLPQDALDNLANLGKEMLAKVANDAFSKGIKVDIPTSNLPIAFDNPKFRIVDHAIYIESDISAPPSVLNQLGVRKVCNRVQGYIYS